MGLVMVVLMFVLLLALVGVFSLPAAREPRYPLV